VWVGGEDRSIHFTGSQQGEGGRTALPIFGKFMEKIYRDKELGYTPGPFPKPSVKISKKYTCISESEPRRRRAEAVDTIAADNLLEQMNGGAGLPDSIVR